MLRFRTIILALFGVLIFWILNLPLPFLFGPLFMCLALAIIGVQLKGIGRISIAARTILGVAIGASITPALVQTLPSLITSILLVPLFLAIAGLIGLPWFQRVWGMNFATAYYSAMPGGLQDMVIFGEEAGGDVRALTLIHSTRVLFIVTMTPFVLTYFYGATLDNPLGQDLTDTPFIELMIMFAAAIGGWLGGARIGLFGASILGPMIVATALSLAGIIHFRPPKEAILIAQFLIGTGLGVQFVGITIRELRNFVFAGIGYVALLWLVAAAFIFWLVPVGPHSATDAMLAFSPGGQAEMTVLAIIVGADLGFVIAHHITRIVCVIIGAPLFVQIFKKLSKPED